MQSGGRPRRNTRRGPEEGDPSGFGAGETPDGEQSPVLNVFTRDGDGFRHRWATELMFAPRDEGEEPRHVDLIWPIWNVLDMTPGGRGSDPGFPALQYR